MKLWQFSVLAASLSRFVLSVLVEDAFQLELIKYSFDPSNYQIVDGLLFGNVNQFQFGRVDLNHNNSMVWNVDLDQLPIKIDQVIVGKSLVYLYNSQDSRLVSIDKNTGILNNDVDLTGFSSSSISNIVDFFGKGALILSQDSLAYISNSGDFNYFLGTDKLDVSKVFFDQIDGKGILITNKHAYLLSVDLQIISSQELNETPVQFKEGILFTKSNIQKWNGESFDVIKADSSLLSGHIIDPNHIFTVSKDTVSFYSLSNGEFTSGNKLVIKPSASVSLINYGLSSYLIVSEESLKQIYDLTDYLITEDFDSIKHVKTHASGSDYIGENLTLITVDNDLKIKKTNLVDGRAIKEHASRQYAFSSKSLLIDLPESEETIEKVHHLLEDSDYGFVILRWLHRVHRHLTELGKAISSLIFSDEANSSSNKYSTYGFAKLLVFYNSATNCLTAIESIGGELHWETPVNGFKDLLEFNGNIVAVTDSQLLLIEPRNGKVINAVFEKLPVIKLSGSDEEHHETKLLLALLHKDGYHLLDFGQSKSHGDIYFVDRHENVVSGNKINQNDSVSHKTWTFSRSGEVIVDVVGKSQNQQTASVGISLANKSVLYKYLYPNTLTIVTKTQENALNLYIIDGITGNLLFKETQSTEHIDFDSVNVVKDDNWLVYSYFVNSPKFEQRINVIDLFDSKKSIAQNDSEVSVFATNSTIDSYTKKSYIFPERIVSLGSTHSKYGITLKSIIAVTDSGAIIEIPKYVLNSRRIDDRQVTSQDMLSDFRMSPYAPDIPQNNGAVLNHKYKLNTRAGSILTKPTNFESTSVVCYVNEVNCFCTLVKPSSSFDLLTGNFDRIKLLITIVFLLVAYVISKPFVADKKLKAEWVH